MNAVVPFNQSPAASMTVSDVERVAMAIAKGGLFGSKDPNAVLTLCLLAQAEGQHPAVVFRDYHIISGRPAKKAEAMLRDFISAGGKIEWHQLDDDCADATFSHPSGGSARISWDHARAQKAQIAGNAMYKKYPRQMLRSRTISEGVRTVYPGATSGLYEEGEVASFEPVHEAPHAEVIDHEPTQPNEPAPRSKLDGPHTSKTALRRAVIDIITKVRLASSNEEIDNIQKENIETIRQANKDWPALLTGDPNIEEDIGLKGAIELRREQLESEGMVHGLIESMKRCESRPALASWVEENGDMVDALDDADRRKFELAYELHESALLTVATANT